MLPYDFLKVSINKQVEVILKNDEAYSGMLESVDPLMNIVLLESRSVGLEKTYRQTAIKGNSVKFVLLPKAPIDDAISQIRAEYIKENPKPYNNRNNNYHNRGNNYNNRGGNNNNQRGGYRRNWRGDNQ